MKQDETIRLISATLDKHGSDALAGGVTLKEAAHCWVDSGFDDPEEIEAWLLARCFEARHAQALEEAGFTPEQAGLRTKAGTADYEDTIAYKLSRNDLSFDEARRIINSLFWNA